jgi:hypothetical protein
MNLHYTIPTKNLQEIQQEILKFFPKERLEENNIFYVDEHKDKFLKIPALFSLLKETNCIDYINCIAFVILQPGISTNIHIDSGVAQYSLNIPIKNCENTYVTFFENLGETKKTYLKNGKFYHQCEPENCIEIDKIEMSMTHIISVKQPHIVSNEHNKTSRIALLFRLDPEFDLTTQLKIPND